MKMKVEKSFLFEKKVAKNWPTTTADAHPGPFLIQKIPPPFLVSPPPESNQRISLQVWKQQQLELKVWVFFHSPFLCLNAGTREVFG